MEKREQEALYSVIQGFVGKSWNGSYLYHDPCGWTPIQGVTCDIFDDGYWFVTALNIGLIHENSLSCVSNMEFSSHLFALKHLKSLSFVNCMLHKSHPITIPTQNWSVLSGSLESLEFRSNPGLIGQIPSTFGSLSNLQSLVLLENGLSGELPTNLNIESIQLPQIVNWICYDVAYVLGQLQNKSAIDALSGVLKDVHEHPMVRHKTAEALGSIADGQCIALLEEFVKDPEPIVSQSCEVALSMLEFEKEGKAFEYLFMQTPLVPQA